MREEEEVEEKGRRRRGEGGEKEDERRPCDSRPTALAILGCCHPRMILYQHLIRDIQSLKHHPL